MSENTDSPAVDWIGSPPPSERLGLLEARNAALLAELAKATSLAQVRAAAAKAAEG